MFIVAFNETLSKALYTKNFDQRLTPLSINALLAGAVLLALGMSLGESSFAFLTNPFFLATIAAELLAVLVDVKVFQKNKKKSLENVASMLFLTLPLVPVLGLAALHLGIVPEDAPIPFADDPSKQAFFVLGNAVLGLALVFYSLRAGGVKSKALIYALIALKMVNGLMILKVLQIVDSPFLAMGSILAISALILLTYLSGQGMMTRKNPFTIQGLGIGLVTAPLTLISAGAKLFIAGMIAAEIAIVIKRSLQLVLNGAYVYIATGKTTLNSVKIGLTLMIIAFNLSLVM